MDIGDAVKKGDVLAEIDAPLLALEVKQATSAFEMAQASEQEAKARVVTAQAEVEAAKGRLKEAQAIVEKRKAEISRWDAEVNRLEREVKKGAVAPEVLFESQNRRTMSRASSMEAEGAVVAADAEIKIKQGKLLQAEAATKAAHAATDAAHAVMEKARIQESFTQLRAALDGVVIGRHVNSGDFVSASDAGGRRPLLTVLRTDSIRIVVNVAENDVPFIHSGVSVHLDAAALPDVKLPECRVSRTGYAVDEKTGTMPVEIDVPNRKNLLRPGMGINAAIALDKKAPAGTVTVPASAVVQQKDRLYVYVVRDGKAHLTPIEMSYSGADSIKGSDTIEIKSGVQASDRIVADPRGLKGEVVPVEVKKTP